MSWCWLWSCCAGTSVFFIPLVSLHVISYPVPSYTVVFYTVMFYPVLYCPVYNRVLTLLMDRQNIHYHFFHVHTAPSLPAVSTTYNLLSMYPSWNLWSRVYSFRGKQKCRRSFLLSWLQSSWHRVKYGKNFQVVSLCVSWSWWQWHVDDLFQLMIQ